MTFTLTIDMDNDAFGADGEDPTFELGRILGRMGREFCEQGTASMPRDVNGNRCGRWEITA